MGWFDRLFPHHDATAEAAKAPADTPAEIPIERQGPEGTYDQSGLAKRVVKAFDEQGVADAPHLYVAQTGTTVVFKGNVHTQAVIDELTTIAKGVNGTMDVDSHEVHITG